MCVNEGVCGLCSVCGIGIGVCEIVCLCLYLDWNGVEM